mmetsp:Transcript_30409/g.46022  ORF Transcript_30409/g.46022 Transcript_30409/m.46022 type:complete len:384 (-) Transcript_30409:75-1226(-)
MGFWNALKHFIIGLIGGHMYSCDGPGYESTECVLSSWRTWKTDRALFDTQCSGNLVNWGDNSTIDGCGGLCCGCTYIRTCCDTNYPFTKFSATYTTIGEDYTPKIKGLLPKDETISNKCYIYLMGSGQNIEIEAYYEYFLEDMASHNFCAATVEYPESSYIEYVQADIEWKSESIFNPDFPQSAIHEIEKASSNHCQCDHVVVHGFSQGGHIATLSANYNPNVDGVLLFSGQCQIGPMDRCELLQKNNTDISKDKIRNIFAQDDGILGCGFGDVIARSSLHQAKLVTGQNCEEGICDLNSCPSPTNCDNDCTCANFESNSCLSNNDAGGGYYAIKKADYPSSWHEWFLEGSPKRIWKAALTTTEPFNIPNNLAWLRNTTVETA